ncbi:MAG TPA: hypothetical protein VNQ32_15940 [Steroidobacteraceae bacterium]|nr:hypothetical protein [Steroidobacteraceae bacterium]
MSRPSTRASLPDSRKLQKQELNRATPLRELFPQVSELHVELDFDDGSTLPPSQQNYSYFPGARTLFRYACPCKGCDGELGLHDYVAEVATAGARRAQQKQVTVACPGQRLQASHERTPCPIRVRINISATLCAPETR